MPRQSDDLTTDLQDGMVPISKAASSIAALIKRSRERRHPIIITQKDYPVAALLSVEQYTSLCERAGRGPRTRVFQGMPPAEPTEASASKQAQLEAEAVSHAAA